MQLAHIMIQSPTILLGELRSLLQHMATLSHTCRMIIMFVCAGLTIPIDTLKKNCPPMRQSVARSCASVVDMQIVLDSPDPVIINRDSDCIPSSTSANVLFNVVNSINCQNTILNINFCLPTTSSGGIACLCISWKMLYGMSQGRIPSVHLTRKGTYK